jgi:hypothetical protein
VHPDLGDDRQHARRSAQCAQPRRRGQLEPTAAAKKEPTLRKALALHEYGQLSKDEFLSEVRRVADRAAVRRAIVALATASEDAGLKELVRPHHEKGAASLGTDEPPCGKPLRASAVAVATAPAPLSGCKPICRPASPERPRTWWL